MTRMKLKKDSRCIYTQDIDWQIRFLKNWYLQFWKPEYFAPTLCRQAAACLPSIRSHFVLMCSAVEAQNTARTLILERETKKPQPIIFGELAEKLRREMLRYRDLSPSITREIALEIKIQDFDYSNGPDGEVRFFTFSEDVESCYAILDRSHRLQVERALATLAEREKPRVGRPPHVLRPVIAGLAELWILQTGQHPGYSTYGAGPRENARSGPFIRFCNAIIAGMNSINRLKAECVRDVIRETRNIGIATYLGK